MLAVLSPALPKHLDKVVLDESVLEQVLSLEASNEYPLIFKLSNETKSSLVGVRQFTAELQTAEIPEAVFKSLDSPKEVSITPVSVPKGTLLAVRALSKVSDLSSLKYFLEANLSKYYTTLSKGQVFSVSDLGRVHELEVLRTEPADSICVVDTEMAFDVELGAQEDNKMDIDEDAAGKELTVKKGLTTYTLHRNDILEIPDSSNPILSTSSRADIIVSRDKFVSEKEFIWLNCMELYTSTRSVRIDGPGPFFAKFLPWDSEEASFVLELSENVVEEPSMEASPDHIICPTCKNSVLKRNFVLHQNFCARNNKLCPLGCGKVFLRTIPEDHWHCQECFCYGEDKELQKRHRRFHSENIVERAYQQTQSPEKLHECRFCHLVVPVGESTMEDRLSGLSHHENSICGSKTLECHLCKRSVRQRDYAAHYQLHEIKRKAQPKESFLLCSNHNCCATFKPDDSSIQKLCALCSSVLYSSTYDPDGRKLAARLERKYVLQLTRGCGNGYCKNPECVLLGLSERRGAREAVGRARELIQKEGFWFCVDESMTKKKMLAEGAFESQMDGQKVSELYRFDWVAKGVAEGKRGEELKEWLRERAVRKDEEV